MKSSSKYEVMHEKAAKQRSITPETYRGDRVKFAKSTIKSLVQKDSIEDEFFYVDQYQYKDSKTSHVLHFGINIYIEGLQDELSEHNKSQKDISESKLTNNTNNHKAVSKSTSLTEYEKIVLKEAFEYLKTGVKTVLVDVFERDKAGIVSSFETHTVVLYNNAKTGKVFVIDPSNPQFSSHIANFHQCIEVDYSDKMKIYQPPEKASEKGFIGPNTNQWRDCIDIAVKIAFGLNNTLGFNNLKETLSSDAILSITNSYKINDSIPDQIQEKSFVKIPLRIQQKSNLKIGNDFYKFSKVVKQNLVDINDKNSLEKGYVETLYKSDGNACINTLKILFDISKDTFVQIHKELEQKEIETLGNSFNPDNYEEV